MILIADSGGTKTDWLLIHSSGLRKGEVIATFHTQGITPIHQTPDVIRHILGQELMSQLSTFPRAKLIDSGVLEKPLMSDLEVFFYGSGCTPAHVPMMKQMLGEVFDPQKVEVHSDLMAAARALCQHEEGIACILGTGANSCLYDGNDIVQNTPALGYILGDEGSANHVGRRLLQDYLTGCMPRSISSKFHDAYPMTREVFLDAVYHQPNANRFLASLAKFAVEHINDGYCSSEILFCLEEWYNYQLDSLIKITHCTGLYLVGGFAAHIRPLIEQVAENHGLEIKGVAADPIDGLLQYHIKKF